MNRWTVTFTQKKLCHSVKHTIDMMTILEVFTEALVNTHRQLDNGHSYEGIELNSVDDIILSAKNPICDA